MKARNVECGGVSQVIKPCLGDVLSLGKRKKAYYIGRNDIDFRRKEREKRY